jgi:hypothetical protein
MQATSSLSLKAQNCLSIITTVTDFEKIRTVTNKGKFQPASGAWIMDRAIIQQREVQD